MVPDPMAISRSPSPTPNPLQRTASDSSDLSEEGEADYAAAVLATTEALPPTPVPMQTELKEIKAPVPIRPQPFRGDRSPDPDAQMYHMTGSGTLPPQVLPVMAMAPAPVALFMPVAVVPAQAVPVRRFPEPVRYFIPCAYRRRSSFLPSNRPRRLRFVEKSGQVTCQAVEF